MDADRPDPSRPEEPDHGLDIDAAFAEIVAHWEPSEEPPEDDRDAAEPDEARPVDPPADPDPEVLRALFHPAWQDEPADEVRDHEEHFVPPPPPPLPAMEPRRRLAWSGLLGTPLGALLMVALGVSVPGWVAFLMVVAFVGGFTYLVATMGSSPPDDWTGGDGAVL